MQRHTSQNQEQPYPPSTMAPTEYEAMVQDVAFHMSRSDLLRRLSTHSSSTSGSNKRGSMRVTKQTSASNSPIHVQRRRTTANHSTRSQPRTSQDNVYQIRDQRLHNYYNSKQTVPYSRPMSWHPGSNFFAESRSPYSMNEPALGHTIADLENLAVSSTPDSSIQQPVPNAFAAGYGSSTHASSQMYDTSPQDSQEYGMLDPSPDPVRDIWPTYSVTDPVQYLYGSQMYPHATYPAAYQALQQWPQNTSYYAMSTQIPQAKPDHPPMQDAAKTAHRSKMASAPQLSRRKSKELVGMGLYDDREVAPTLSGYPPNDSQGKGLKLEETWQPPNDEGDEQDDEEVWSTDDEEDVEEVPPPVMPSCPAEAPTSFFPTYGDMSNQSFFFNDDEDYVNDEQYSNYLAFPGGQQKPRPNTQMQNYLWF